MEEKDKQGGPIIVELTEEGQRNEVMIADRNLSIEKKDLEMKDIFINPDMTLAERKADFDLRQERNKRNKRNKELSNEPFRWGIRGNELTKIRK